MEADSIDDLQIDTGTTEIDDILRRFAESRALPVEAIEAARARRDACIPIFLRAIDDTIAAKLPTDGTGSPIFYVVHMLGEWREKAAYRPLVRLLQCDPDRVEDWLGDALTETVSRVLAGVFDGDPVPLYEIIANPKANEWARHAAFDTFAKLARVGAIDRDEAIGFLRDCYSDLRPRTQHHVWVGWVDAVAILGLREFEPLVRETFDIGFIDPLHMNINDFQSELDWAVQRQYGADWPLPVFADTIDELDWWYFGSARDDGEDYDSGRAVGFDDDPDLWSDGIATRIVERIARAPAENPFRHVGRNDPCPCGSGRKFKKCCMS